MSLRVLFSKRTISANVKMVKAGVPIGDTKLLRYSSSTLSYTVVVVSQSNMKWNVQGKHGGVFRSRCLALNRRNSCGVSCDLIILWVRRITAKPQSLFLDEAEMDEMLAKKYVEFYEFKGIDDVNNRAAR